MTEAVLITIANAIASELDTAQLAAGTFNRSFKTEVVWANRFEPLEDLKNTYVSVAPINWAEFKDDEGDLGQLSRFHIAVRKRFESTEEDSHSGNISAREIEDLVTLLSDLVRFFIPRDPDNNGRVLTDATWAAWTEEKGGITEVIIDWEDLKESRQFTGYFPLTYESCG